MPRAKTPGRKSTPSNRPVPRYFAENDAPWGGFLNARLDDDLKARFAAWFDDNGGKVWQLLDDAVSEGLKYSLAYDGENEAYIATLTGRLCLSLEQRWAASARAGTWEEATALVLWKHFVLAEGNWDMFRPSKGDFMKWG